MQKLENTYFLVPQSSLQSTVEDEILKQLPWNSFKMVEQPFHRTLFQLKNNPMSEPFGVVNSKSEILPFSSPRYWSHKQIEDYNLQQRVFECPKPAPRQRYRSRVCPYCERQMTTKHFKRHVEKQCPSAKLLQATEKDRKIAASKACTVNNFNRNQLIAAIGTNVANEIAQSMVMSNPATTSKTFTSPSNAKSLRNGSDHDVQSLAKLFLQGYTYSWLPGAKVKSKKTQTSALLTILKLAKCHWLSEISHAFWDRFFQTNTVVQRIKSSKKLGIPVARRMQYQRCKALHDFVVWLADKGYQEKPTTLISLLSGLSSLLLRSCKNESGLKKTWRAKYEHSMVLPLLYSTFLDKYIKENNKARNLYGLKLGRICVAINGLTGCR